MERLGRWILRWRLALMDERGATTAEYALILALVAVVLIGALSQLGMALSSKIQSIADTLGGAG